MASLLLIPTPTCSSPEVPDEVGVTPDPILKEIRAELRAARNFDTTTREGLQGYLDWLKLTQPQPRPVPEWDALKFDRELTYNDIDDVSLEFCHGREETELWTYFRRTASRMPYRRAPGRIMMAMVRCREKVLGVLGFSSPLSANAPRDSFLKLPTGMPKGKGALLRPGLLMSTCVSVGDWAAGQRGGKLLAALAVSAGVVREFREKYHEDLKWLETSSIYGESVLYDRLFRFLGLTKGYGNVQVPETTYQKIRLWLRWYGLELEGDYFRKANGTVTARLRQFSRASGVEIPLRHGQQRGVYIFTPDMAVSLWSYGELGREGMVKLWGRTTRDAVLWWLTRWDSALPNLPMAFPKA